MSAYADRLNLIYSWMRVVGACLANLPTLLIGLMIARSGEATPDVSAEEEALREKMIRQEGIIAVVDWYREERLARLRQQAVAIRARAG